MRESVAGLFNLFRGDDRAELARAVLARLGVSGREGRYDPATFSITVEGGGVLNLDNLYAHWRRAPRGERADLIEDLVGLLEEEDQGWDASRGLLRPLVRPLAIATEYPDPGQPPLPFREFVGELGLFVGVDRPRRVSLVTRTLLDVWGRGFDEVYDVALENLARGEGYRFDPVAPGLWISSGDDFNDSAWLLLPHLIRTLEVRGDPVAVPVSRRCLIVAGADDARALAAMRALVERCLAEEPQPLSDAAIVLRGETWRPLEG